MVKPWLYSLLGLAGFLVATYLLVMYGLPLLLPFVVALIVAEMMEPMVGALTWRNKVPRSLAVMIVLLLFSTLITTGVTVAISRLILELGGFQEQLPSLYAMIMETAERLSLVLGALNATLPESIQGMLGANLTNLQGSLNAFLPDVTKTLGVVTGLPAFLTNLLITMLATFFISRDRHEIGAFLLSLFPGLWRRKIRQVKIEVWSSAMGWAKAQLTLVTLTMVQTIIGLALIGSQYAVLMGILVGLADIMPVLGPAAVFVPWIVYALIFGSKAFGIKLLIVFAIVTVVRQLLEAKVVSDRIGLHPLAILVAIYLGFQLFGAMGFVVGPLVAILLKAMIRSGLLPIFQDEPPG